MNSTNSGQFDIIEIMSSDPIDLDATLELFNCSYCGKMDTRRSGEKRDYCYTCAKDIDFLSKKKTIKSSIPVCECGAHKTQNPNLHSSWCPLA